MKEYTVDFESFEVEAKSYDEAWKIANSQAWKEYGRGLDDELFQDEEQKPNRWTAVFNSLYITAKNYEDAWDKASHFAKLHNLDIIEIDDGYDTDFEETTLEDLEN